MSEDDKFTNLFEIIISENLKPGDLVQLTYGNKIVCRFVLSLDESRATEKFILKPVTFQ